MREVAELMLPDTWETRSKFPNIECPSGKLVIEMLPSPDQWRGIYIPDEVARKHRPDVGIVIAIGSKVTVKLGDLVIVRPGDGCWQEGPDLGEYIPNGQIRVYGANYIFRGCGNHFPWQDSVPLTYNDLQMKATGNNVLIRRTPIVESEGNLYLPDSQKYRSCEAVVESLGPDCQFGLTVSVGDRINYDNNGLLEFDFKDDPDLAIVRDIDINFIIRDS